MKHFHPRPSDKGQLVEISSPSKATPLSLWETPSQIATVIPDGSMPDSVNGITVTSWSDPPARLADWEALAGRTSEAFEEPAFKPLPGKTAASGAVILELDGRVWAVSPSNRHGGYVNTFPKGTVDAGLGLRGNALKEVFEESGLQIELTGFLCDSVRSTSVTRYYLARRAGGNPANMGWETQAVHLVPMALLVTFVNHPNDQSVIQALKDQV